jgi:hypothetical protein
MIVTDKSLPSLNDRHYSVPFAVIEYSRSYHPCYIPFRSACLRHFLRRRKFFSLSRLFWVIDRTLTIGVTGRQQTCKDYFYTS